MEERKLYLESMIVAESVLGRIMSDSAGLSTSQPLTKERRLVIADKLDASDSAAARSRAEFIRRQMSGDTAESLFNEYREAWGIPDFKEDLVTIADFRSGFMWRFRDHTTSWSENQYAQQWFLTSAEALSTTTYELLACDNGPEECIETIKGSYRHILQDLLNSGVYEVLISPTFTKKDLDKFMNSYSDEDGDFALEDIIEDYISLNPHFEAK